MKRVTVVGGGVSGLASAFYLREAFPNVEVTLLEGRSRLGGNVHTLHEGGLAVEAGPDGVVTARTEVRELLRRLGLESSLLAPSAAASRVLLASKGALRALPDGMIFGVPTRLSQVLGTPLLSLRGKLRAALDLVLPDGPAEDRSVGALIERRLGREVKDCLVEPMVGGIFAADIDRLDPSAGLPMLAHTRGSLLRTMAALNRPANAGSALRAPAAGMSALVEALEREVGAKSIWLSRAGTAVRRTDDGFLVDTDDGNTVTCDHLVLAVPPRVVAELLRGFDPGLAAAAEALRAASTATVILVFPAGTPVPDSSGLLVPRTEGRATLAATFINAKWARASASGEIVVRAFLGGARSPTLLEDTSDDELAARALADLRAYLPLPAPVRSTVIRFAQGTPQPEVGHGARVARLAAHAGRHPGLSLVSAAYEGPGIAGCIAQAARLPLAVAAAWAFAPAPESAPDTRPSHATELAPRAS